LSTKWVLFSIFQQIATFSTAVQQSWFCNSLKIKLVEKIMSVELVDAKYIGLPKQK